MAMIQLDFRVDLTQIKRELELLRQMMPTEAARELAQALKPSRRMALRRQARNKGRSGWRAIHIPKSTPKAPHQGGFVESLRFPPRDPGKSYTTREAFDRIRLANAIDALPPFKPEAKP